VTGCDGHTTIKHPFSGDDYVCSNDDIKSLDTLFELLTKPTDQSVELLKIFNNSDGNEGLLVTYKLNLFSW
jgi:hypothetical protein